MAAHVRATQTSRETVKVAVVGGSGAFTPEFVYSLLAWEAATRPPLELILIGRSAEKVEKVAGVCRRIVAESGLVDHAPISISTAIELAIGLEGASYILHQIRVGGLAARVFDETYPQEFGLPGEETIGAGGFADALRTIPIVLEQCAVIRAIAPQATVINLTNPASIVGQAMTDRGGLSNVIGVCDAPVALVHAVSALLDRAVSSLTTSYVGINHVGWLTAISEGRHDLLNEVVDRIEQLAKNEIDPAIIRATRAIPNPFLRYLYQPERILHAQRGAPARGAVLQEIEADLLHIYAQKSGPARPERLAQRGAVWYPLIVVPVLEALINDRRTIHIVNVTNGETIPWLPPNTTLETDALIGNAGAQPLGPHPLPVALRPILQAFAAYEELCLQAISSLINDGPTTHSRELALRALLINPFIPQASQAMQVLERVWPSGLPDHDVFG